MTTTSARTIEQPELSALAERCIDGGAPTRGEALAVLRAPDELLLDLLAAAYRVRRHFYGDRVLLHVLKNVRSGLCSEDCAFCSQSRRAKGAIERHELLPVGEMVAAARRAREAGAYRYCMVGAFRVPGERHLELICEAVRAVRDEVGIRVCVSMGILSGDQAERLARAGADRYNHNLETSRRHFPSLCTTHGYDDRVRTVELAHRAGLSVCSGGIVGTGESDEDLIDLAYELRRLGVESVPVNFLDPRPGTPLAGASRPDPRRCLKVLSLFRFVLPTVDLRAAGGREVTLRALQPLALYPCNSMFTRGYLTTGGNDETEDLQLIRDLGFEPDRG